MLETNNVAIKLGSSLLLDDVGLSIEKGELVGLIGPNGAGKTTLLRALAGLRHPDAGTVRINNRDIRNMTARDLSRLVAYLAQDGEVHWPLSVEALVTLGRLPHRRGFGGISDADRNAVERAMAATDINAFRHRTVAQVSGGERMRILLARALAVEAPLLIADEPIAALDPLHQLRVMELLVATARRGHGVIVALHDLSLAARFCDRLILLAHGGIAAQGEPAGVLTDTNLARAYGIALVRGVQDGIPFFLPKALDQGA